MKTSDDLQKELELFSKHVYFQPPESVKLVYPCIIFRLANTETRKANNKNYMLFNRYRVTHIFKNLENEKKNDILNHFQMVTHDIRNVVDNLYHDEFILFY